MRYILIILLLLTSQLKAADYFMLTDIGSSAEQISRGHIEGFGSHMSVPSSTPVGAGQCGYPPSTSVVCTGYLNYCGCPEHAFNCWNRSQFLITAPLTKDSLDHWKGLSID